MMKKIITADNTESYFNEQVGECYHSYKGAVEEAWKKYVVPCKIAEIACSGELKILDICFGLGYNSAAAIDAALQENPRCSIEVVGLENDPGILEKIQEVKPPLQSYRHYKKLSPAHLDVKEGNIHLKVLLGDGREQIKTLPESSFDAIFLDPFSPQTSPEMWQEPFFREMWRVMKPKAIVATYSCARMVRENMSKAGLFYDDGPIWGRRGPGTIATKWI